MFMPQVAEVVSLTLSILLLPPRCCRYRAYRDRCISGIYIHSLVPRLFPPPTESLGTRYVHAYFTYHYLYIVGHRVRGPYSYHSVYKMSVTDEPSGDLSGSLDQQVPEDNVDQGSAVTPTEAQENAALSKPVYLPSHLPQEIVPGVGIPQSRKHEDPLSELELETPPKPFTIGSGPHLVSPESKALLPHTNPEEEKGIRESRNTHQRSSMRVNSSVNSLTKQPLSRKRSMSEGSTPHSSMQQASDDGYVSPFVVQQLKDRLRQLEEKVANDADEKKKFEGLYISEKQKCEEIELKSSKYEQEVAKLRKVVYKLDKFGKYAVLTTDEESLVQSVHAEQGMDNA